MFGQDSDMCMLYVKKKRNYDNLLKMKKFLGK